MKHVQLLPQLDAISWKWTKSGIYTEASAYKCHAEPKSKFFAWLVAHRNIRMADNLALWGWPHDPICKLYCIHPDCSFITRLRDSVLAAYDLLVPTPAWTTNRDFDGWWVHYIVNFDKENRRITSGIITYIILSAWKERNRKIFTNMVLPLLDVVRLIKDVIEQRVLAFTEVELRLRLFSFSDLARGPM
jgi:hypothetical protein